MRQLYFCLAAAACAADYDSAVLPVFQKNCLACHSGKSAQAGLDLSSLQAALKGGKTGPALKLGSAESSMLMAKINSGQMPPGKPLDAATATVIRQWIDSQKPITAQVTEADVVPIFQMRCVGCHGKRKQEGGLDLRTQASRLKGGKSGPAIIPGKAGESLILKRINAGEMPPPKLFAESFVRAPSSEEVATLTEWISAGTPPAPEQHIVEETFTEQQKSWWAFQSPKRPSVPNVSAAARVRNPIDALLLQKLETKKISFSAEASRTELMRRAYLDLTGLVPTPEEIDAWEKDTAPGAYERLIDRLLESPRYGERWAKIWLDAAGYSDSEGIIDEDKLRPQAWRYRDSVIRAIQRDQPYDRFLIDQIAGDEASDYRKLDNPTQADVDRLAATGFLRMAPDGTYSPANGSVAERMNVIADEIEVLASSTMGLTVGCARCHNHKYDPIPQRDYYRLGAILQTSYDPFDWTKPTERNIEVALRHEREAAEKHNGPLEAQVKKLEAEIKAKAKPYQDKSGKEDLDALAKEFPEFKAVLDPLRKSIADAKKKLRAKPEIRALYDMGGDPSPVFLLKRGDAQLLGERVEPRVLSVLDRGGLDAYRVEQPWEGTSGRRLALARWLTQPNHPLTARVMVNRMWRYHFGRGIVPTLANFGKTGAAPTHPELLDWLATEFVSRGWSVKAMHRLMMTSAAYRQSSRVSAEAQAADPENALLSRMPLRRMDSEQLHDSVLRATGRLSAEQFGPPVTVETKAGGEVVQQSAKEQWRRAIYVLQRRTTPVTMLEVFDLPPMSPNCTERALSTVSTQALEMRNSPVVLEHARYLAARLIDNHPDDRAAQVQEAFERTLSRRPKPEESERVLASMEKLARHWEQHLSEERSLSPRAATARWYALADAVHALLSSAEFAYVD
ncbi:MAG: DUF1553 domain-containing protein [Bryobacteraceae bacterium]